MSNNTASYIPKLNDRDVIRAFESVATKYSTHEPIVSFKDPFGGIEEDRVEDIKKLHGNFLNSATIKLLGCQWSWQRLRPEHSDPASTSYDKLVFNYDQQSNEDRSQIGAVSAAIDAALSRPLASVKDHDINASIVSHSKTLQAMESVAAKIIEDAAEHKRTLDIAYLQKEQALNSRTEETIDRELGKVREERKRIEDELFARKDELDLRQLKLDELQTSLNNRNNTHVRREIRLSLMQLTKERLDTFSVSGETRRHYLTVHAVSVLGMLTLAGASYYFGSKISTDSGAIQATVIALAIKSAASAITAIALGSWYLGWLNRWLQRIADAEFKLQQFRLDIERASWLAETLFGMESHVTGAFPRAPCDSTFNRSFSVNLD